ncbi:hypothetical protein AEM51_03545 [Bacteroidetes bacterium UKL13-3]|jgi:hypothetical protein|nr:hypothetical protein AEM51_03545 [Bacteroidetes bacterium UKL13-3]HCP94738.1 DUF3341 domain-containing protein [Bacteroidota bacterium]
MANKMMLGVYDNADTVFTVTENLVKSGYDVHDVYTPFAVHNLDKVIGVKRTRLSTAAFVFAMTGLLSAVTLQVYASYFDWQMNIGGKPSLHIPTYIPITFELSILFTAFGMVGCFFFVNRMFPGRNTDVIDLRVTDDRFVIAVNIHTKTDVKSLEEAFVSGGALEVRERVKDI